MDQVTTRFLAEIAARRRIGMSMNVKAEYNSGMLRGNPLHGDNGAPTPKSGKKAKLTLALPRGKTDLEAQARRAAHHGLGCIDREQDKPSIGPLSKDDVLSTDMPMGSPMRKFVRELRLDGADRYVIPSWQQATERADLLTAPKTVKPRLDRQNRPKRDVVIERKRAPHKSVKATNNS